MDREVNIFAGAFAGGIGGAAPELAAGIVAAFGGAENHGLATTRAAGGACTRT